MKKTSVIGLFAVVGTVFCSQQVCGQSSGNSNNILPITQDVLSTNSEKRIDGEIAAENMIHPSSSAIYEASKRIVLKPGFKAKEDAYFRASIVANIDEPLTAENSPVSNLFQIFPSIATDKVNLIHQFNGNSKEEFQLSVYDYSGILVFQKTINRAGNGPVELDVRNFKNGLFVTHMVSNEGEIQIGKFVVQH